VNPIGDIPETVEILTRCLDALKLPFAFGGAIAQNYWGTVRATQDIDG
jgi:hypothetical protein